VIRIGSRGSDLALWQARHVSRLLADRLGLPAEITILKTAGDRIDHVPLAALPGKGFFTKELEDALLAGSIDLAVHSHKDLPSESPPGLVIAATPEREDASDTLLVRRGFEDTTLPIPVRKGARLGTGSNRRRAQLALARPDLDFSDLRGNVPTRVAKLARGDHDAILLATAGLRRLGLDLSPFFSRRLPVEEFLPAPAQGVLALQVRESDVDLRAKLAALTDPTTARAVLAERTFLALLHGGCQLPVAAHATLRGEAVILRVFLAPEAGVPGAGSLPPIALEKRGTDPERVAREAFDEVLAKGGRRYFTPEQTMSSAGPEAVAAPSPVKATGEGTPEAGRPRRLLGKTVVVTRAAEDVDDVARRLESLGARVIPFPVIRMVADRDEAAAREALAALPDFDWVLFTSAAGVRFFLDLLEEAGIAALPERVRVGAIGPATAAALRVAGIRVDFVPGEALSESLAAEFLRVTGAPGGSLSLLLPAAREGRTVLLEELKRAGHRVTALPLYRTLLPEESKGSTLDDLRVDYLLFASPSAVRNFLRIARVPEGARVVTIGPVTSEAAKECGLAVYREAAVHTMDGMLEVLP
jgi:hydroxymethylbilane synthase